MENNNTRSFEIDHTAFTLGNRDGYTVLESNGPHWGILDTDGSWAVFKGEHYRMRFPAITPESAAAKLLELDRAHRDLMASFGITPA